jgi:CRP-like cAMP-binding protein
MALEPTETLSLRRDQFEALRSAHPSVDRMLVQILAARVRRLNADLVEALFVPAETRVLRRVAALAGGASSCSTPARSLAAPAEGRLSRPPARGAPSCRRP